MVTIICGNANIPYTPLINSLSVNDFYCLCIFICYYPYFYFTSKWYGIIVVSVCKHVILYFLLLLITRGKFSTLYDLDRIYFVVWYGWNIIFVCGITLIFKTENRDSFTVTFFDRREGGGVGHISAESIISSQQWHYTSHHIVVVLNTPLFKSLNQCSISTIIDMQ